MQHYYFFITKDKLFQSSPRRYITTILKSAIFCLVLLFVEINTFIFPLDENMLHFR